MPRVYAGINDGVISNTDNVSWAATRDATSGDSVLTNSLILGTSYGGQGTGIGTAGYWSVWRSYFQFDVSAITDPLESAILNMYFISSGKKFKIVRMERNFTTLDVDNFAELGGFVAGATMAGNVTDYIDGVGTDSSGFNVITLNAQARADMLAGNNGNFNIAVVGYTYDYLNVEPDAGDSNVGGLVYNDFPNQTFDCYIDYEYPVASKSALAGGDFTRTQLRDKTLITAGLSENTLYEVVAVNNSPNQVYLTMEGDNLFRKPGETTKGFHIETTNSVSGSNVINYIQENPHASFILAGATGSFASASFLISSSVGSGERGGNSILVTATNGLAYDTLDPTNSGSTTGINFEIFDI